MYVLQQWAYLENIYCKVLEFQDQVLHKSPDL